MATKRGLGRGLGALINDGIQIDEGDGARTGIRTIAISDLQANALQPRRRFDHDALAELAASIRERGILQPLLVRVATGGGYELIAGERRLRASLEAGLTEVPVIIVEAADHEALEIALIENLQREDLNAIEEADGYRVLAEEHGLTQEQIAEKVGKSRAAVANALRLLDLPDDVRHQVIDGSLSAGHAKVLAGLGSPEAQLLYAGRTVRENLSVRNLEKVVEKDKKAPRKPRSSRYDVPGSHLTYLSDRLHAHFGTSVRISSCRTYANGKKGKGTIEIDYFSNEDLSRILDVLQVDTE